MSFDNGGGAGSAGLLLGAGINQSGVSTLDVLADPTGGTVVGIEAEAIAGQTLTLSNGATVTVLGDSTAHTGVAGPKNIETAITTPNPGASVAKKLNLTINPSTTGTYSTLNSGLTVTSGSPIVTGALGTFTGDAGQTVAVEYLDTTPPNNGYFNPFSPPPPATQNSPAPEYSFIQSVSPDGSQATIAENEAPLLGATSSPTENLNSQVSASVVVTIGSTAQATSFTTGTDYDLALTGCQSSIQADPGEIYPNNVTLTNTGPQTNPDSAIALEAGVKPITGADINFPAGLPSGYTWGGALPPTNFVSPTDGGFSQVTWNSLKDNLNLSTDQETFVGGTVTGGPFAFAKASLVFGVGSMIVCTDAQVQAIAGAGGIDAAAGPHHVPTGGSPLVYCDGGSGGFLTSGTAAFGELAIVEADPNAAAAGSDGTGLAGIWQVGGTGSAKL